MRLSAFSRVQFPSPSKLTGLRFPAVDSFLPLLPLPERSWATFVVNLFTVVRHSSEAFHDVCKRPLSSQSTPGQNDEGIRKCQIFLSHQNCHISTFVILHKQRCGNIWLPKHQLTSMTPQALLHFFRKKRNLYRMVIFIYPQATDWPTFWECTFTCAFSSLHMLMFRFLLSLGFLCPLSANTCHITYFSVFWYVYGNHGLWKLSIVARTFMKVRHETGTQQQLDGDRTLQSSTSNDPCRTSLVHLIGPHHMLKLSSVPYGIVFYAPSPRNFKSDSHWNADYNIFLCFVGAWTKQEECISNYLTLVGRTFLISSGFSSGASFPYIGKWICSSSWQIAKHFFLAFLLAKT